MGQSETIEDKRKSNKEFREFMDELEKDAKAEEDRLGTRISETARKHYENNGWDYARLFGDKRSDYQNYADWSLTRITNIIEKIGGALTASDFPSAAVPGSEQASKDTVDKAKQYLSAFSGDYSLVIARVQALITGVLSQFAVASEVTRSAVEQDMPLSGGMHLFFASTGNVFKRDTFFTNQFIGSFQIVFECYMSADEARAIALSQILKTTERELDLLNAQLLEVREAQAKSLKDILYKSPADYVTTKKTYDEIVASLKDDIQQVFNQYQQYKGVVDTVDKVFPRLDLSEFGVRSISVGAVRLDHLFDEREASIARRYVRERLNS